MKTAIVVGATGLVGQALVEQLLTDRDYDRVVTLGRRVTGRRVTGRRVTGAAGASLSEHVVDFEDPASYRALVQGDVLFSALGTTLKAAGSQAAQRRVDHDYQLDVARAASANGVSSYVLISAAGSHPHALVFYSRMKGELEAATQRLAFERVRILRPGPLKGPRREVRAGERLAQQLLGRLPAWGPLAPLRPIHVEAVAGAARALAAAPGPGVRVAEPRELFALGDRASGAS